MNMDYEAVRTRLGDMLASVNERVGRIHRHVGHRDEAVAADFAEQAVELENAETLIALDDQLRAEAREIQAALTRLDEGHYGLCENCGEAVGDQRLDALPETRHCITCAATREDER